MQHIHVDKPIAELLEDGARFREAMPTLNKYLEQTRGVGIYQLQVGRMFVVAKEGDTSLLRSASYTACLEFALGLPIKVDDGDH